MKRKRTYPVLEVYRSGNLYWYWRLRAANGRIIVDGSEGYAKRGNAIRAARKAREIMARAVRWEFK